VAALLAAALFWIWVLFVAPAAPEDKLKDPAFSRAAQTVCTNAINDLSTSNLLNQKTATPGERADLVERQSTRLASMLQQLRGLSVSNADDAHAVSGWLDDWDQWLRDRATWATQLRAGQDVPFNEKADVNGDPNSKPLVAFAITNEMSACVTPYGV
jgi:hypothetical protein